MCRHFIPAAVAILLTLAVSAARAGRGDKVGSASASQLSIPVGGRSIGLGGSVLATVRGAEAMFWNPAGLVRSDRSSEVVFSHMSYLADIGVEYAAAGTSIGGAAWLGVSIKSLSIGEIPVTTELFPDGTGAQASPTFLVLGATFSRKMSDEITVGLTANVIHESLAEVSATGIAFTGGVQYSRLGGVEGLSVGVVIRNIGPKFVYDGEGLERKGIVTGSGRGESNYKVEAASGDLPSTIEVGLGYLYRPGGPLSLSFSTQFQNNNFSDDEYKFGVELTYAARFYIRTGYDYSTEAEGNESLYGPAFGIGLVETMKNVQFRLDYAYRSVRYFGGNHAITLTLGL